MTINIAAWYEKYSPMVIRRCRVLLRNDDEAMDAVQDVFINLLRAKGRLNAAFPSSLLYTMATNVCLNRLRERKREAPDSLESDESGEDVFPAINGNFDQVEAKTLVDAILEDESEDTRAILFMYHADRMTLHEIGQTVGLSVSGVSKRLEAFKKRARLKLGEEHK